MITVEDISLIPAAALRAEFQADGTVLVYMPGDELPPAPEPQPEIPQVPQSVTMRQARLALLGAGVLSQVEGAINAMPEPQKSAARITWEYSAEVQRHNGLVSQMAPSLGLTSAQIDELFTAAARIP
jgi:hypothetical protein